MEEINWHAVLRWIHVLAGTAWFGEVVTINFVLAPAAATLKGDARGKFLAAVFPRIFRLASILSLSALIPGLILLYLRFTENWSALLEPSGLPFLIGGSLAFALTAFHFFLEPKLGNLVCIAAENPDGDVATQTVRLLHIIPRAGLAVITLIVLMMMIGARGV